MVAPSWESFQRPNQQNQEREQLSHQQQEFEQELPGEMQDNEKPQAEKPQWGNFLSPTTYQGKPDPNEDESTLEYLTRNATQLGSRVLEQTVGRHGNIEKFSKDVLSSFPKSGGLIGWAISELVGPEKWERLVRGPPGQQQMLPTSDQLRKVTKEISKGYTEPKTKGEEKISEFVEDVGSTLTGRRAPTAINNLLIPAAANVVKQIVKETGFGEDKAQMAKLAVWLPLSLAGNVNAPQYASQLMNQGRNGLPNTLHADIPRFTRRLDAVANSPLLLHSDPRTALARQTLAGIRNDIANGQTNSQSLFTMFDGVNAAKRNRGLFELGRSDQNFARRAINEVRNAIRDEILDVGVNHPEAIQSWQNGVRAWATIHQSNAISNWVESAAKGPYSKILSGPAAGLFGIGAYGAHKLPAFISGAGSVAIPASYKTGQVLYRMWNDPNLRAYYWNAIAASQTENLPVFISNYNKLNKGLEKSESVKPNRKSNNK